MKKTGLIWRGFAMGIAETIPGVSGGTIAFITGIYKQLIDTISSFDASLVSQLFRLRWREVWDTINGPFLVTLVAGMFIGVVVGVFGVTYLLDNYPEGLWAFFFALILASIYIVYRQIREKKWSHLLPFVFATVIAYVITIQSPAEGSENLLYILFGGFIAICALVLPGISGSFILLLLGLYTIVIPAVRNFLSGPNTSDLTIIAVFGVGALLGLVTFSKIVKRAFERHHDMTLAALAGFMFGSLNRIWPWRNPVEVMDKDSGSLMPFDPAVHHLHDDALKILREANVLPGDYLFEPHLPACALGLILGLVATYLMVRYDKTAF